MKHYFLLQRKRFNRQLTTSGIPLPVGYGFGLLIFVFGSILLFDQTIYAPYIYCGLVAILLSKLSQTDRNLFLKSIFTKRLYHQVRCLENVIYTTPFIIFLLIDGAFLMALIQFSLAFLLAFITFKVPTAFTLPTPFSKRPFEFSIGFRKTSILLLFAYVLAAIALSVDNFNLGFFAILLVSLICMSYYFKPEDEYYVWTYNLNPKRFLFEKVKIGLRYFTGLALPIIIALALGFPQYFWISIAGLILGQAYLITIILAKYAAYPNEIGISQGILVAISLMLPPILIGIIPLLYSQAITQLKLHLNDSN